MERQVILRLATAVLLSCQLSIAQECPLPGWAEGLVSYTDPSTKIPTDDTADVNASDCVFHQWSWEAFVWATAIEPQTKLPRFIGLPTEADLTHPRTKTERIKMLRLKTRSLKPQGTQQELDAFQQAGSNGILVDQQGHPLLYSVHMTDEYFATVQTYYGVKAYMKAGPHVNFPVGSAVFKAAWKIVTDSGKPPADSYCTAATIPRLIDHPKGGIMIDPSGATRSVTVALVGLHVVGVTENHPEFLWGSFEQVRNSPSLSDPEQTDPGQIVSNQNYTFYKAGTPFGQCNQLAPHKISPVGSQRLSNITNVVRRNKYGGADRANARYIRDINSQAQTYVKSFGKPNAVFANYSLVGTVWLHTGTLQPGDDNLNTAAVGSVNLANSVMETFVQGTKNSNCFACHNTGGFSSYGIPGKNINLSHVILSPLFNSPAGKARKIKPSTRSSVAR